MWTALLFWGGVKKNKEMVSVQGHSGVSTDRIRGEGVKKKRRRPSSVPPPSLLSCWRSCRWAEIGVARPQLYWGQLSARLCWNYGLAFCPRRTDLAVTLNTASPRGWQILSPHFPNFAEKTNRTHQPTVNPTPPAASPKTHISSQT